MTGPLRCAVVDCRTPPMAGNLLCAEHKPKPLTLREQIARGPKFKPQLTPISCIACDGPGPVDGATALDVHCWRAWRWSAIREYEL